MHIIVAVVFIITLYFYLKFHLCQSKYSELEKQIEHDLHISLNLSKQKNHLKEKKSICNKSFNIVENYQNPDVSIFDGRNDLYKITSDFTTKCKLPCSSKMSCDPDHQDHQTRNCKNLLKKSKLSS